MNRNREGTESESVMFGPGVGSYVRLPGEQPAAVAKFVRQHVGYIFNCQSKIQVEPLCEDITSQSYKSFLKLKRQFRSEDFVTQQNAKTRSHVRSENKKKFVVEMMSGRFLDKFEPLKREMDKAVRFKFIECERPSRIVFNHAEKDCVLSRSHDYGRKVETFHHWLKNHVASMSIFAQDFYNMSGWLDEYVMPPASERKAADKDSGAPVIKIETSEGTDYKRVSWRYFYRHMIHFLFRSELSDITDDHEKDHQSLEDWLLDRWDTLSLINIGEVFCRLRYLMVERFESPLKYIGQTNFEGLTWDAIMDGCFDEPEGCDKCGLFDLSCCLYTDLTRIELPSGLHDEEEVFYVCYDHKGRIFDDPADPYCEGMHNVVDKEGCLIIYPASHLTSMVDTPLHYMKRVTGMIYRRLAEVESEEEGELSISPFRIVIHPSERQHFHWRAYSNTGMEFYCKTIEPQKEIEIPSRIFSNDIRFRRDYITISCYHNIKHIVRVFHKIGSMMRFNHGPDERLLNLVPEFQTLYESLSEMQGWNENLYTTVLFMLFCAINDHIPEYTVEDVKACNDYYSILAHYRDCMSKSNYVRDIDFFKFQVCFRSGLGYLIINEEIDYEDRLDLIYGFQGVPAQIYASEIEDMYIVEMARRDDIGFTTDLVLPMSPGYKYSVETCEHLSTSGFPLTTVLLNFAVSDYSDLTLYDFDSNVSSRMIGLWDKQRHDYYDMTPWYVFRSELLSRQKLTRNTIPRLTRYRNALTYPREVRMTSNHDVEWKIGERNANAKRVSVRTTQPKTTRLGTRSERRPTTTRKAAPCDFYARFGKCRNGDSCRFSHVDVPTRERRNQQYTPDGRRICAFFARGRCNRGEHCRFAHVRPQTTGWKVTKTTSAKTVEKRRRRKEASLMKAAESLRTQQEREEIDFERSMTGAEFFGNHPGQ
jgi:hypothetical protein